MKAIDLSKRTAGADAPGEGLNESVFALVYGASGTGKTHLVGTCAELWQTLVIDVDKGYKTLLNAPALQKIRENGNLFVTTFDAFEDLDHAYQIMQKNDSKEWSKVLGIEIKKPFECIVWDSWSELQWQMQQQLRKDNKIAGTGLKYRPNLQIQHWGAMTDLNKLCVESLRDVPINQVFVMLETMSKDELSGAVFGGPAIHGKLVAEMPGYFDVVVHTYTDLSGKFFGTTKSKGKWPAKTRLGEGKDIPNPTAATLFVPQK